MNSEFSKIVNEHTERYPLMTFQDYYKLAYQSEFGPRHMLDNCDKALEYIDVEWSELKDYILRSPEPIGNGLCRFYMNEYSKEASELLGELFYLTAKNHIGSLNGLYDRLSCLEKNYAVEIEEYKSNGCPIVHHSKVYNEIYKPHYRLLKWEYACFFNTLIEIRKLDKPAIVAIDGRCGSGKTGLASIIKTVFDCNVFHVDDYYLPLMQRADNWEQTPAGNIDLQRFNDEVLLPAKSGEMVYYRPYNCGTGEYKEITSYQSKPLTIIEGSYSHHPFLSKFYDLKIFLTCDCEAQKQRLMEREGDYYTMFQKRWIPMEELYFDTYNIEKTSDLIIDTSSIF